MTTLKDFTKNQGIKVSMMALWLNKFEDFKVPFDNRKVLTYGSNTWNKSKYSELGLKNNINPCFGVRKAIYRSFYAGSEQAKLGYVASNKDTNEIWCSYFDGTTAEVNQMIDSGKSYCDRYIHMHMKDGKMVEASVTENGKPSQYKIGTGKGSHTASAYIYCGLMNLLQTDSRLYQMYENLYHQWLNTDKYVLENDTEFQENLTLFENDVYITLAEQEESTCFKPAIDIYGDAVNAINNGAEFIFGEKEDTRKASSKSKVNISFTTVEQAQKSGKYRLNHVFASGEEKLVPDFYGTFDLTPEEEKMCKLIKGSELLATKRGGQRKFLNFMLQGEAGTGKSTAAAKIAQITGLPWRTFSCSAGTEEMDLLKKIVPNPSPEGRANIYVDSEIVETFRNGGIIEIQEVNLIQREGVINILNRGLDDFGVLRLAEGTYIHRHPDCVVIFTMNPDYEGTKPVNQSLLSRCQQIIEFNLPDKKKMVERVAMEHPLDKDLLNEMAESLFEVRRVIEDETVCDGICSYRELNSWAEEIDNLVNVWGEECNPYQAALNTVVNHATADKDVRAEIANVIAKRFSAF